MPPSEKTSCRRCRHSGPSPAASAAGSAERRHAALLLVSLLLLVAQCHCCETPAAHAAACSVLPCAAAAKHRLMMPLHAQEVVGNRDAVSWNGPLKQQPKRMHGRFARARRLALAWRPAWLAAAVVSAGATSAQSPKQRVEERALQVSSQGCGCWRESGGGRGGRRAGRRGVACSGIPARHRDCSTRAHQVGAAGSARAGSAALWRARACGCAAWEPAQRLQAGSEACRDRCKCAAESWCESKCAGCVRAGHHDGTWWCWCWGRPIAAAPGLPRPGRTLPDRKEEGTRLQQAAVGLPVS